MVIRARVVFVSLLLLVFASGADAQSLRRGGGGAGSGAQPSGQEPTIVRLTYTDPGEYGQPGSAGASIAPEDRKLGRAGSIVGAMIEVRRSMESGGGGPDLAGRSGEEGRGAADAVAVLKITPGYMREVFKAGNGEWDSVAELVVDVTLESFTVDPDMPAERVAALQSELALTLERIRNDMRRLLTDSERGTLFVDGQVRLALRTALGDSPFSHHQLFDRPEASLLLRRWPKPQLRFVVATADGGFRKISLITPFQPFRVEAVYEAPPDPAPDRVFITTPGGRFQVPVSPSAEDPLIWRSAEILPVLPAPDIREAPDTQKDEAEAEPVAGGPDDGLDGTGPLLPGRPQGGQNSGEGEEGGEGRDGAPARSSAGTGAQPAGDAGPPALTGLPPIDLSRSSPPSIYDDILPMTLKDPPVGLPVDSAAAEALLLSPLPGRSGETAGEAARPPPGAPPAGAPATAPPGSGIGPGFGFGIDPNYRFTPGQGRRGPVLRRPAPVPPPRSPLLSLIDRFGPDDPQVAALLADGISAEDEAEAARILAERAEDAQEEAQ